MFVLPMFEPLNIHDKVIRQQIVRLTRIFMGHTLFRAQVQMTCRRTLTHEMKMQEKKFPQKENEVKKFPGLQLPAICTVKANTRKS